MQKTGKKLLSVAITVAMLLTMLPASVLADNDPVSPAPLVTGGNLPESAASPTPTLESTPTSIPAKAFAANAMLNANTTTVGMEVYGANPGFYSRNNSGINDWETSLPYYFLENDFAKYLIGTNEFPQTSTANADTGAVVSGSMMKGYLMDAAPKTTMRENLDYTEFVLVPTSVTDLRNWWYQDYKLSMPTIEADAAAGTVTAKDGVWGRRDKITPGITSSVTYSMVENSPLLKMEITLTNTGSTVFEGKFGYIICANETSNIGELTTNLARSCYIPGYGWYATGGVVTPAFGGAALTGGWTDSYIYFGRSFGYNGYTAHSIIWNRTQQAAALNHCGNYTNAWFDVSLDAGGGTKTLTLYHMAEVPSSEAEPYAATAQWAAAINSGELDRLVSVSGTVTDTASSNIANATVTFTANNNVYTGTTSATGFYSIYVEKDTEYTVKVEKTNFQTLGEIYSVIGNNKMIKNFTIHSLSDEQIITNVKALIEGRTFSVEPSKAKTENDVVKELGSIISRLDLDGASATVIGGVYTPPINGTAEKPDGISGTYSFSVKLSKGVASIDTNTLTIAVPACTYAAMNNPSEVGFAAAGTSPGDWSYTSSLTKDWDTSEPYYYLENEFAKYLIGTHTFTQAGSTADQSGYGAQGAMLPGYVMDAVSKTNNRENLDFAQFVLVQNTYSDLRNWWYQLFKLRLPDISANAANKTVTASGGWDYAPFIKSNVKYSILENSPLLKMEVTLTNTSDGNFNGKFGYIIRAIETAAYQYAYIPGSGWKTADSTAGSQLTSGWTGNYIYFGGTNNVTSYTGNTGHAIIWDRNVQDASALTNKNTYAGAWFNAVIPAGGSKTITMYHLAEVPTNAAEPYKTTAQWAKAIREGTTDSLASVSGKLTNKDGAAIGNTEIMLTSGSDTIIATTSIAGIYQVYVEKGKTYTYNIQKKDFKTYTAQLDVSTNVKIVNNITLEDSDAVAQKAANEASVAAVKALVEALEAINLTGKPSKVAKTPTEVIAEIEAILSEIDIDGVTLEVSIDNGATIQVVNGTVDNPNGIDGAYAFNVKLYKGENTPDNNTYAESTTKTLVMRIPALNYQAATSNIVVGKGEPHEDPGFLTYSLPGETKDWDAGDPYYYLENSYAKYIIGTSEFPQNLTYNDSGFAKLGSLVPGLMVDAVSKSTLHENIDYTEIVLVPSTVTDLRNWWYSAYKLNMPEIEYDLQTSSVTAKGDWDNDSKIASSVKYSMLENSPLLKMEITLTNNNNARFSGNIGYIFDGNEGASNTSGDRYPYVPGVGWFTTDATSGTQLTSGWNDSYVYYGRMENFNGKTGHAVLWNKNQPAVAVIPKYSYTGAWFNVSIAGNGGTQTITIYHLAEVPASEKEPYASAALWANAINGGNLDGLMVVSGTVTNTLGEKVIGATIEVADNARTVKYTGTTSSDGFYYIWVPKSADYWISASTADSAEIEKKLMVNDQIASVDFVLGSTAAGTMPAGKNPVFESYAPGARDWDTNQPYYYLQNRLASYLIGTNHLFGSDLSGNDAVNDDLTGNNRQGSLAEGSLMDAVPLASGRENLDFTEFVLAPSVQQEWFYPNGIVSLANFRVDNAENTVTAAGSWDGNSQIAASVTYSLIENSPLVKMEVTLRNNSAASFNSNFGYIIDPEVDGGQYTYIPNTVEGDSGLTDNFIFSGKNGDYSGDPAHAIIWPVSQVPNGKITKDDFTGVWFPVSITAGGTQTIVLYHLSHIPSSSDAPYAIAEIWAAAAANGSFTGIATVNGTVTDSMKASAIQGVTVSYTAGVKTYRAVTDVNGAYQLFVPMGQCYTVIAAKSGYTMEENSRTVNENNQVHQLTMLKSTKDMDAELPDSTTAITGTAPSVPELNYSADSCKDWAPGDVYLESNETTALVSAVTGAIIDIVPNSTKIENIATSELVLTGAAASGVAFANKNFNMSSIVAEVSKVKAAGTAQVNSNISAEVTYSVVENSPLIKVKVSLNNNSTSTYKGSFGYIVNPEEPGEGQSYLPGSGWNGGDPLYSFSLKNPGSAGNYIFNGNLGKYSGKTAHSIIWSKYSVPEKLTWGGGYAAAWYPVNLTANGVQEIIFYHLAHVPGEGDNPLDVTEFWSKVIREGIDPSSISRISGTVTYGDVPSANIKVTASAGDESYTIETGADGRYMIYGISGTTYSLQATNGKESSELQSFTLSSEGKTADLILASSDQQARVYRTYGDPGYVLNPGVGLRDWSAPYMNYIMENDFTKLTLGTRRLGTLIDKKPSEYPGIWSKENTGNGAWGSLNSGTIMDAVSKQTNTENLDWSSFVLFPTRPSDPVAPDYFSRNYVGVTPEDEAQPNEMYMEWSWWFPVNMLELGNISTDGESVIASGLWDGGVNRVETIESSVKYSLVDNSPLVKMDITLTNNGTQAFDGQFAYLLDPDMEGEQHSYLPGIGWEYSQTSKRYTSGWNANYVFDGFNGFSGNTAHAIIWPDDQQPMLVFNEAGWISAWFKTSMAANGGTDTLTIYYLPHTPGGTGAPYSVAEYWANFIAKGGDLQSRVTKQASVMGVVTDSKGNRLSNLEVSLETAAGTYISAVTDFKGGYTLFAEEGEYTLSAYSEEYAAMNKTIMLGGNNNMVENISLIKFTDAECNFASEITRGDVFEFTVTVKNEYGTPIDSLNMEVITPAAVKLLSGGSVNIANLTVAEEREITLKALAVYGGRETVKVKLSNPDFSMTKGFTLDISGSGWYGGDNHTHSNNSDGTGTIAANVASAYDNWKLAWLMNTDHNTNTQAAEAAAETARMAGKFVSISATEITTGYTYKPTTPSGSKRGHALVYGYDGIPTIIITEEGGAFDWQDSIDQVLDTGAMFYIAHPFDKTYSFENPYSWRDFTGVEVWNGSLHASHNVNQQAFEFWDKINVRGDKLYYGIAGTDGHNAKKIGDLGIRGSLDKLSVDNALGLIGSGQYYGTNGPDLRFSINGVGMGNSLSIAQQGNVTIDLEAYSEDGSLTSVKVLGYPVTGNLDDFNTGTVVFEKDLAEDKTDVFRTSLTVNVTQKMFFRLEVMSENCTPGSVGNGPDVGTGFAYSNPVWVEIGSGDTSRNISSISYDGTTTTTEADGFGRKILYVGTRTFNVDDLRVEATGMVEKSFMPVSLNGSEVIGLLDVEVSTSDYAKTVYSFVVNFKASETAPADDSDDNGSGETPIVVTPSPKPEGSIVVTTTPLQGRKKLATVTATVRVESEGSTGVATAKLDESILKAIAEMAVEQKTAGQSVVVEFKVQTAIDTKAIEIEIPRQTFNKMVEATNCEVKLDVGLGVIHFDAKAIEHISSSSSSGNIIVGIKRLEASQLPPALQEEIKDRPVYDFTIKVGSTEMSSFGGGSAQISLPYQLKPGENKNSVVVCYIDNEGTVKMIRGKYAEVTGTVEFKTSHFSQYAVLHKEISFRDVSENAWYKNAVGFIAARGIITGMGDGNCSPEEKLTRGQYLVMMMRAYDMSADENLEDNFADAGNTYYTPYLAAAKKLGITSGTGNNLYMPENGITRQEMFTILYKTLKIIGELPQGKTGSPLSGFKDADELDDWAREAMAVLTQSGIVNGSGGRLDPLENSTRAQMAQLLYNLLSK